MIIKKEKLSRSYPKLIITYARNKTRKSDGLYHIQIRCHLAHQKSRKINHSSGVYLPAHSWNPKIINSPKDWPTGFEDE